MAASAIFRAAKHRALPVRCHPESAAAGHLILIPPRGTPHPDPAVAGHVILSAAKDLLFFAPRDEVGPQCIGEGPLCTT